MNDTKEKYLPIGSVCLLKGGTKKVMVTGFCAVDNADTEKMYDYSGCMYPEGFLSSDQTALFDHNQIEKVFHVGYIDEEETTFKNQLKGILEKASKVIPIEQPPQQTIEDNQPISQLGTLEPEQPIMTKTIQEEGTPVLKLETIPPVGPGL